MSVQRVVERDLEAIRDHDVIVENQAVCASFASPPNTFVPLIVDVLPGAVIHVNVLMSFVHAYVIRHFRRIHIELDDRYLVSQVLNETIKIL
jgi:hypothetical protein